MSLIEDYVTPTGCKMQVRDDYIDYTLRKDTVVARIQYLVHKDQLEKQNGKKGRER